MHVSKEAEQNMAIEGVRIAKATGLSVEGSILLGSKRANTQLSDQRNGILLVYLNYRSVGMVSIEGVI